MDAAQKDRGQKLWEGGYACGYERILAAAGIAEWADVTSADGKWVGWAELQRRFGQMGKTAEEAYRRVRSSLKAIPTEVQHTWEEQEVAGAAGCGSRTRYEEPLCRIESVCAARKAPLHTGGWEYFVRWADGRTSSWEPATWVRVRPGMKEACKRAQLSAYVPYSYGDSLRVRAVGGAVLGRVAADDGCHTARTLLLRCGVSSGGSGVAASWTETYGVTS